VDAAGWEHKVAIVRQALAVNAPNKEDALDCLAKLGGFEIGLLAGAILEAASRRIPVVLDGFITGAAALVAWKLDPEVRHYLVASHQSQEIGHKHLLERLGLRAFLNLDLRLGEGSGAALFLPLVDAAAAILRDMATFESAGVSDKG
jgi:nicotinate-nucleotide--dimethylbenzimidazole phosphoribosyltransferase